MRMFLSDDNSGDRCLITEDDLSVKYVPCWGKKHWDVCNGVGDMGCDILQLGCLGEYSNPCMSDLFGRKCFIGRLIHIVYKFSGVSFQTPILVGQGLQPFIRMIIHIYLRSRLTHTARLFYTMRFFFFRLQ